MFQIPEKGWRESSTKRNSVDFFLIMSIILQRISSNRTFLWPKHCIRHTCTAYNDYIYMLFSSPSPSKSMKIHQYHNFITLISFCQHTWNQIFIGQVLSAILMACLHWQCPCPTSCHPHFPVSASLWFYWTFQNTERCFLLADAKFHVPIPK